MKVVEIQPESHHMINRNSIKGTETMKKSKLSNIVLSNISSATGY